MDSSDRTKVSICPSVVGVQNRPSKRLAREFAHPDMGCSCREGGNAVWQHPMTWLLSPRPKRYKTSSQVIVPILVDFHDRHDPPHDSCRPPDSDPDPRFPGEPSPLWNAQWGSWFAFLTCKSSLNRRAFARHRSLRALGQRLVNFAPGVNPGKCDLRA